MSVLLVGALAASGCGGGDDAPAENPKPNTSAAATTRTSPSGLTTKLELAVDPARPSSAGKPTRVVLGTELRIDTPSRALPSELTGYTLRTDDDFEVRGGNAPTCAKADLAAGAVERCKAAKVGGGNAEVHAQRPGPVQSKIEIFNGGHRTYLFRFQTPGLDPQVTAGKVKDGPGGLQIEVPFSRREANPVRHVSLDFENLEAPSKCDGFWSFDAVTRYASGEKLSTRATIRCTISS